MYKVFNNEEVGKKRSQLLKFEYLRIKIEMQQKDITTFSFILQIVIKNAEHFFPPFDGQLVSSHSKDVVNKIYMFEFFFVFVSASNVQNWLSASLFIFFDIGFNSRNEINKYKHGHL